VSRRQYSRRCRVYDRQYSRQWHGPGSVVGDEKHQLCSCQQGAFCQVWQCSRWSMQTSPPVHASLQPLATCAKTCVGQAHLVDG
jgi:hypothetical protein